MTAQDAYATILRQIAAARPELEQYAPRELDWAARCVETANQLVPWLISVAKDLKSFVEEVVNSRKLVRHTWQLIKDATKIQHKLLTTMDRELDREEVLLAYIGGDVVSKIIECFLIDNFNSGTLESNGRSDYPDLFLRSNDYTGLPKFSRKVDEYGAALKGKKARPVRVPDGLEVKTCRGKFAVDCHHAHAGLHIVLLFADNIGTVAVDDILIAFMRKKDYRITKPRTPTTTLKASFNGQNFVSLFT